MRVAVLANLRSGVEVDSGVRGVLRAYLARLEAEGARTVVLPPVAKPPRNRVLHRLAILRSVLASDVVVIRGHLYATSTFNLLRALGRPIVYSYVDAIYTFPTGQQTPPAPGWIDLVRSRLHHTLRHSAHVLAASRALADYARQFNPRVTILPVAVKYDPCDPPRRQPNAEPVVGWIGRPENLVYVRAIAPALRAVQAEVPFTLRVVCREPLAIEGLSVDYRPWAAETEDAEVASFDIAIVPLIDDEWSRGKFSFKAVQTMAVGLPIVVSAVGANCEIVRDGHDGLWARSDAEWTAHLPRLLRDPALRERLGRAARQTVAERYSFDATFGTFRDVLRTVSGSG